ncbi:hypothetical protein FKM82_026167 [Ascaphus truei]
MPPACLLHSTHNCLFSTTSHLYCSLTFKHIYLWDSLTLSIRQAPSLPTFKSNLKTHLLHEASQQPRLLANVPHPQSLLPTMVSKHCHLLHLFLHLLSLQLSQHLT